MEVKTSFTIEGQVVINLGTVDGYTVYRNENDTSGATLFFTKNGKVKFRLEVSAGTSQNFAFISDIDFKEFK